jgi:hypothetical protein
MNLSHAAPLPARFGRMVPGCLAIAAALALGLGSPAPVAAQSITGLVVDQATGAPVPGAIIQFDTREGQRVRTLQANGAGAFAIDDLPPGRYRLQALHGLYGESEVLDVGVLQDDRLSLVVRMGGTPIRLEGITAEVSSRFWWESQRHQAVWPYYERRYWRGNDGSGRFYDGPVLRDWSSASVVSFIQAHLPASALRDQRHRSVEETAGLGISMADAVRTCQGVHLYFDGDLMGLFGSDDWQAGGVADPARIGEEPPPGSDFVTRLGTEFTLVLESYRLTDFEGIEIYGSNTRVPPEFVRLGEALPCAVVSLWLKRTG